MSNELRDGIREYAEWLDSAAPPTHELVPPLTTRQPRFGWARAVVAFAAVLLVGVPLFALFTGTAEVDEQPIEFRAGRITPAPAEGPVVLVAGGQIVTGLDFEPGLVASVTLDGPSYPDGPVEVTEGVEVPPNGRFDYELPPGLGMLPGDTATVAVGDATWVVPNLHVEFHLLDPVADTAVGEADVPDDTTVVVRVEGGSGLTWVETETFDGRWAVDLSEVVDVTLEATATAWVASGDGFAASLERAAIPEAPSLRFELGDQRLEGAGFSPGGTLEITVDGQPLADAVTAGPGGRFAIDLQTVGVSSGDVVAVADGGVAKSIVVTPLAVTEVDQATGTVSGTTGLADGSEVEVSAGTSGTTFAAVADGRWSVTFGPGGIDEVDIGYRDEDGDYLSGTVAPGALDGSVVATTDPGPGASATQPASTRTPIEGRVVAVNDSEQLQGWGFTPGDTIGYEIHARTEPDGSSFRGLAVPAAGTVGPDGTFLTTSDIPWQEGDVLTVRVGETEFTLMIEPLNHDVLDLISGLAAGFGPSGRDILVQIEDDDDVAVYETSIVNEAWSVDVGQLTRTSVGTAWMAAGDGWLVSTPLIAAEREPRLEYYRGHREDGWLAGYQFLSDATISVSLNGESLDLTARSDAAGGIGVDLQGFGIGPGDVIAVTDGVSERSIEVHDLAITSLQENTVAGSTTVPDGRELEVYVVAERVLQQSRVTVVDGAWTVRFAEAGPYDDINVRLQDADDALVWVFDP